MVALLATVTAAAALGLAGWLPGVLRTDVGLVEVDPGLLTVAPEARGIATLGRGYTVAAYQSGFRVSAASGPLVDTITRGSPVSAVVGDLGERDEHPVENVHNSLDHVRIDEVRFEPGRAVYLGEVYDAVGGRPTRGMPLRLTFLLTTAGVHVTAHAQGADAVVVHLDALPATTGLDPALPDRNLRKRGWWIANGAGEQRSFTSANRAVVGVGPAVQTRALDLRPDGRLDVHVWSNRATLTLSGTPRRG
ncbi:hypothetical protein N802_13450 [Knoellia sinensis KCTC 19936]|uniref:Uncharacterized protein n=2 Tax=Knoellia TaxID=136099 RepID=A0A0A0JAJ0_9MICO|nr:hypothetical protein N802_13450 [Knoellia sinensis KCTC 19936]